MEVMLVCCLSLDFDFDWGKGSWLCWLALYLLYCLSVVPVMCTVHQLLSPSTLLLIAYRYQDVEHWTAVVSSGILSILFSFVSVRQVHKCCLYINCHPVVVAEHFSSILNIWCPICGHSVVRIFKNSVLWLVIRCQWLRVCVIQRRYTWIEIVAQFLHWREECKDRNI